MERVTAAGLVVHERSLLPGGSSFDETSNENVPPPPPGTVGPTGAVPGDPNGVEIISEGTPAPWPRSVVRPSAWSGWPAEWETPLWGGRTADLTDTAWTCVDLNSRVVSIMPPYLIGAADSLNADWLNNPDPDKYNSWVEFAKQLVWDYLLGEVFVLSTARYATGWPARFHVVAPWLVNVDLVGGRRRYSIGGVDVTGDMLHVGYQMRADEAHGHGPLEAGALRLVAARLLARYAFNMIAGGGLPTGVLEHPDELTAQQSAELQQQWVTARQQSMGLPAVVSGGVTFKADAYSPEQLTLMDLSRWNESRIAVLLGVPPFLVGLPSGGDSMCVDTETEILTRRGWKRYDEVIIGEEVLALDHDSGLSEWQPLLDVSIFDVTDRAMVGIEMVGHSSFSTDDHQWPIVFQSDKTGRTSRRLRMSRDLKRTDAFVLSAMCADTPVDPKYSDAFVEWVAWFYTEGWTDRYGCTYVSQNERINSQHCDRIRACLHSLSPEKEWSEYHVTGVPGGRSWRLRRAASADVLAVFDDVVAKVPSREFLYSLTPAQLELFISVSIWADGCESGGQVTFKQKSVDRLERFELACVLAGKATMRHACAHGIEATLRRRGALRPMQAHRRGRRFERPVITSTVWTGRVWCPTTPAGTWFARRRGTTYFTHNTYSNVSQIFDYHWRAGLSTYATTLMAALSTWLLPRGTAVEVNRDEYIKPDPLTRAQTEAVYAGLGVLDAQQIAELERFNVAAPSATLTSGVLQ